jgi:alkylation response protein AidB-like acyl-CoA dehydrogenase
VDRFELGAESRELLVRAEKIGADLAELAAGTPGRLNRALVESLATHGLLELLLPKDGRISALDLCLLRQGVARRSAHAETALAMQGLGAYPLVLSGSDDLQKRWIPLVRGGRAVPAFALTELVAGSDAAHLQLRADADGPNAFRLTGEKAFISNAPDADFYTVFARTGPGESRQGISCFLVEGNSPGLKGESLDLAAPHPIGTLLFDGVLVSREQMVGTQGEGFAVAMRTLDLFRPSVGAFVVGMAETARDLALEHAQQRFAFGRPIVEFQAVSHQLADMAVEIEAAKMLVYRAAAAHDRGDLESLTSLAASAKLYATEAAQRAVDGAVQILGARALVAGHPLAELYQHVRAPRIYEGTSEIQRNVIARELVAGRWPS